MNRDEALKLLRGGPEGIATWNGLVLIAREELREKGKDPRVKLFTSKGKVVGVGIGLPVVAKVDLRDADLSGTNLRDADLTGADLYRANLSKAILFRANLSGANLGRADFTGADLTGADLKNVSIRDLNEAVLIEADLRGANLFAANLRYADLTGAKLSEANFRNADLSGAKLSGTDLTKTFLHHVTLTGAKLDGTNLAGHRLSRAMLAGADLTDANLTGANLTGANLTGADLTGADLTGADLTGAILTGADLTGAILAEIRCLDTIILGVDLSKAKGLESVRHDGPSALGIDTFFYSKGRIPEVFLRGCGVPDALIVQQRALVGVMQPIQFYSCFISYSTKNQDFAERLHAKMRDKGLRVWFAPEDVKGGEKLHEQIDEAIRVYDKLLLVLSPESMDSEWVKIEIRKARKAELKDKRRKLFPIRLVEFNALRDWECIDSNSSQDLAEEVRQFFIPDFSNWKDHDSFEAGFSRLLRDLRSEESTGSKDE